MDTIERIVIIGGGLAAANAAETLRQEGFTGTLTVVGKEPHLPYERPPLSKGYLMGKKTADDLPPHDAAWYDEHDVAVLSGTEATAIDPAARTVSVDSGDTLEYDALLLATGAEPRVPDLPGAAAASYLRTKEDSDHLREALAAGGKAVLVGGGWIGLELAAAARQAGMDVTVLEMAPLPLGGVLGETVARYLVELHTHNGVDIRTGVTVESIETADGRATGVVTADGTLPADLVVVAVGAAPVTGLAEAAGLTIAGREAGGGVAVDEHLRTSDPHIWAAGDVANAAHTRLGPLRVEHWDNAIRQGKAVARSMLGQDVAYDWQPYFYTDQFDFGMEYVGRGSADDDVEIRGSLESGEFIAYWLAGDTVTAGMNVNIWDVNDQLRELIGSEVDRADLTDLR
ncbi:ferredoxin reductase [Nocardioides immobilis]|uniref:Ferredoxin reductase n=1 Tax=Nocardioides immobilis TaxID=2049295 RepID=A0A417Y8M4_9ACTN|nr:FAD-dependent oxidoreductase [Nocardioides immobilis]RHW29063.1 ferredoxin reductase [Nocardioides immobilis]